MAHFAAICHQQIEVIAPQSVRHRTRMTFARVADFIATHPRGSWCELILESLLTPALLEESRLPRHSYQFLVWFLREHGLLCHSLTGLSNISAIQKAQRFFPKHALQDSHLILVTVIFCGGEDLPHVAHAETSDRIL